MATTESEAPQTTTVDDAPVTDDEVVLTVTETAIAKILELRESEDDPADLALRIAVTGIRGPEYTYDPNRPDPLAGIDLDLTGSTAEKVQQLLEQQINPGLAAHGGFAELKGVDDDKVYVLMGGGCQGCAVSAMTLREGIAASITAAIPEITEVIDVTDHDAGENPYYS
jgi:Fe/S biogenesis protein NfuA